MKTDMGGTWKYKDSTTKMSLYDTFVDMHNTPVSPVWHYTSEFPFAHKALLWLYESALIYTAVKHRLLNGQEACTWGLPYWPWETTYDYDLTDSIFPYKSASVFANPELLGDATPGFIKNDYFSKDKWLLKYSDTACCTVNTTQKCLALQRKLAPEKLTMDPSQIIVNIKSENFVDFLPKIQGSFHGHMHNFVSCSMQYTTNAGDEPLFYMHHNNVDRLFHLWADCHEYDKADPNSLTPTQYTGIYTPSHPASMDTQPKIDTNLNYPIPLYTSQSDKYFNYSLQSDFPSVRTIWSMGPPTSTYGWNGLYYRYGPDSLVSFYNSLGVSYCKPGNTWTWVNYVDENTQGSEMGTTDEEKLAYQNLLTKFNTDKQKTGKTPDTALSGLSVQKKSKRSENMEEIGTPEERLLYQNLLTKFNDKVQKEGKKPEDALYDLAMESCLINPQPVDENELRHLIMMGLDPRKYLRICDEISEEDIEKAMR